MESMGKASVKKYKALSTQKLQSGKEGERDFDAFEMHDNFLLAMEKLNRMKVSQSKEVDKELEKKEKGFTVYVNGANAKSKKNFVPKHAVTSGGGTSSNIMTARTPRRVYNAFAEALMSSSEPKSHRAASAPGRKRKFWGQGSVEIKESSGAVHKLSIPVAGLNYTEDFETEEEEEGNDEDSIEEIIESVRQSSDKYDTESTLSTADSVCSDPEAYFSDVGAEGVVNKKVDDFQLGSLTNRMSPRTNITHKLPRKQLPSAIARSRSFSISSTRQSPSSKNLPSNNGKRNGETRLTKPPMPKLNLETSPNYSKMKAREDKTVVKRKDKTSPRSQETFDSLLHFNRSHLGRLSTNTWTVDASQQQPPEDSKLPRVDEFADDEDEEEFTIPMLPTGKELVFNIHSTWGDLHYVGLNGIEIFTADGVCADIDEVSADPPDINVLPEYSNDPRTFTNLINGKNQTCDDVNMWLVPYTAGAAHLVRIRLRQPVTVAMIRVWNYNKSRIHSQRGAREISIHLDGQMLFSGEICKASGGTVRGDSFGDNILFTMDEAILAKIAQNDPFFEDNQHAYEYNDPFLPYNDGQRPTTGEEHQQLQVEVDRPFTRANNEFAMSMDRMAGTYCAKCIELRIFSAWDGSDQAGLTGVIPLDEDCMPIEVTSCRVEVAHSNDRGYTLGNGRNLIDGNNFTTSADSMLLMDLPRKSGYLAVSVSFVQAVQLSGLRIYNYNASYEDSYRGVKELEVYLDGKRPSSALRKPLLLRRAPGNVHYDYAQDVMFNGGASAFGDDDNDDASDMPKGFVFKFELLDTWGDHYYVGLNGLQLFDGCGRMIELTDKEVTAFPSSVNILNPSVEDARTPDKLVDGVNDCPTGRHSWLAPFLPGQTNCIYVVFDQPVTVSKVRVWNYSKSWSRGARNFTLFVDDLVIHSGVLTRADPHHHQPDVILLDRGSRLQQQQDNNSVANPLLFYNLSEEKLAVKGKSKSRVKRRTARQVDQSKRPLTSMPKIKLRLTKNVLLH